MKSLSIIRNEHRTLRAILFTLKQLTKEARGREADIDFTVFHGIVYYLDTFLDRFHHPKETEHLFPEVRRKCPGADEILSNLEEQHDQGETLLAELVMALSAWEFAGAGEYDRFVKAVDEYTEFEREHATLEEKQILPLAEEHLDADDWARIDAAFEDNNDPLFGGEPRKEFEGLFNKLVQKIPAPYGYGPAMG